MGEPITGSKLPIARHCQYWARGDVSYPKRPQTGAASNGVRMHDAFASYIDHKVFPPLSPEQRMLAESMKQWWGQRALMTGWETEVSYALNAASARGRRLGRHLNREYGELSPGELALTVDYVWVESGATPIVGDFKTGYGAHVEDPEDNLQLLAGGAVVSMATGLDGCQLEIAHVVEDGVRTRRYLATPLALHRAMHEIAEIQKKVPGAEARAGDHCRWCPALGSCPETQRQLAAVSKRPAVWSTAFISDENDGLLVEELASIKKMIDEIEGALKVRAKEKGGIYLPNGKVYKAILGRRKSEDKAKIAALLGDRYAECVEFVEYEQFRQVKA